MRLAALVLAAGRAERFGAQKLLAPLGAGRLLDAAVETALAAPAEETVVVLGANAQEVEAAARAAAERVGGAGRLRFRRAEDYSRGMSFSLNAGLSALQPEVEGVFVFLGDMPSIPKETAEDLLAAIGLSLAAVPVFEGRRGHPALLRRPLFAELSRLAGDAGAGALLEGLGETIARVPARGAGVLLDVDRPEDLSGLRAPGR